MKQVRLSAVLSFSLTQFYTYAQCYPKLRTFLQQAADIVLEISKTQESHIIITW